MWRSLFLHQLRCTFGLGSSFGVELRPARGYYTYLIMTSATTPQIQPPASQQRGLKVAMVSEHANPLATFGGADTGGQNVYVSALSQALAQRGVEVMVYTRREQPDAPQQAPLAPGVTVELVDAGPAKRIPKDDLWPEIMGEFADQLSQAWSKNRPDVIHSHFWMSGWAALKSGRPLGIPVSHTFHALGAVKQRHQGEADTSPPARIQVERDIIQQVNRVVATCSDEVKELEQLGADRQRVTVIPCGVELELFRPDGPVADRKPGLHRVVTVSRLVPRKGAATVVEALPYLPENTEVVVAGGPTPEQLPTDPEAQRLLSIARELNVSDRLDVRGRILAREDIAALIRSADVFACVPWYEPFGIVPVEAMACGAPVVGSAVGGLLDTIVDGVTGFHVPPQDPVQLSQKISLLLNNSEDRKTMAAAAAARAQSDYSWARIAERMHQEVYAKLSVSQLG